MTFQPGAHCEPRSIPFAEKDTYKVIPGVKWDPDSRRWYVPREIGNAFELIPREVRCASKLLPFQIPGVQRALQDGIGYMFNYQTGLGKTYAALGVCSELGAKRILIVCPAMVKKHWAMVCEEWGWEAHVVTAGKPVRDDYGDGALIINYELLGKTGSPTGLDVIIGDESHRIKNGGRGNLDSAPTAVRAMHLLRDTNPEAFRILLSATPIANRPIDYHAQLDWVWPGRFGSYWKYADYYHVIERTPIPGTDKTQIVIGDPRNVEDLRARLEWCSHTVSKNEIPGLPSWSAGLCTAWEGELELLTARTWILTDTRARAEQLTEQYPRLLMFHGGATIAKRHKIIAEAKEAGRPVVSTMHAVREGIDLTHWNHVLYDQLSWTLLAIVQSMGRFHRLNSKNPVTYLFNGKDARRARVLVGKLEQIRAVIPSTMPLEDWIREKYTNASFEQDLATMEVDEWTEI